MEAWQADRKVSVATATPPSPIAVIAASSPGPWNRVPNQGTSVTLRLPAA
ncbi:MAG TPA: hypothetical protein VHN14_23105 [Kofleriaceae bacterium]|jgi:hypothetical protein|nr:hypothetical protein [Kofleriaceae bacterium]